MCGVLVDSAGAPDVSVEIIPHSRRMDVTSIGCLIPTSSALLASLHDAGSIERVEFHGFAWADDLLVEANLEESPAPAQTHQNYTMNGGYEPMPIPDSERAEFSW